MTVFSKRNALIGWATWMVGKRVFKGRTRAGGRSKKSVAAATAALAAVTGAVLFWRKRKGHEEQPVEPVEQPAEQPIGA